MNQVAAYWETQSKKMSASQSDYLEPISAEMRRLAPKSAKLL